MPLVPSISNIFTNFQPLLKPYSILKRVRTQERVSGRDSETEVASENELQPSETQTFLPLEIHPLHVPRFSPKLANSILISLGGLFKGVAEEVPVEGEDVGLETGERTRGHFFEGAGSGEDRRRLSRTI